jgi:hypothetical protein
MAYLRWPTHDVSDSKDYTIDWSLWLMSGETITDSTWIGPSSVALSTQSHTDTTSTTWITGGSLTGQTTLLQIKNTVTTSQGRVCVKTVILPVGAA